VIENKSGAGGILATDATAKAAPDGYTLLLTTPNHTINAALQPALPYDTEKDIAPVSVVAEVPEAFVNGPRERRLPGNLNVSFDRVESDSVMMALRHFSLSSGSACSSGERSASPVLTAIGVPESLAYGSIRFGLGRSNTKEHIALLVDDLKRNIGRLREISAA